MDRKGEQRAESVKVKVTLTEKWNVLDTHKHIHAHKTHTPYINTHKHIRAHKTHTPYINTHSTKSVKDGIKIKVEV